MTLSTYQQHSIKLLQVIAMILSATLFIAYVGDSGKYTFHVKNVLSRISSPFQSSQRTESCFVALNSDGLFSFKNVCIEVLNTSASLITTSGFQPFMESKAIVVYDSEATKRFGNGTRTISVAGSMNTGWNNWQITFVDGPVPSTHRFAEAGAAYFNVPTCPANFHHFWEDQFIHLWSVVRRTNQLLQLPLINDSGRRCNRLNAVVYRLPYHMIIPSSSSCYSVTRYESILTTLGIEQRHEVFWRKPTNTCFSNAVFGAAFSPAHDTKRDIVTHVINTLLVDKKDGEKYYVTVLQRRERRFVNVDDILRVAKEVVGDNHARVVDFEDVSVAEQMKIVSEACVLVGVHGAGLQWAMFLGANYGNNPKPTLIEVGWPERFWGYYYAGVAAEYGSDYSQLEVPAINVRVNWTSYERECRNGNVVPETERQAMLSSSYRPRDEADNLWKWADVIVDVTQLRSLLNATQCARANRHKETTKRH